MTLSTVAKCKNVYFITELSNSLSLSPSGKSLHDEWLITILSFVGVISQSNNLFSLRWSDHPEGMIDHFEGVIDSF